MAETVFFFFLTIEILLPLQEQNTERWSASPGKMHNQPRYPFERRNHRNAERKREEEKGGVYVNEIKKNLKRKKQIRDTVNKG